MIIKILKIWFIGLLLYLTIIFFIPTQNIPNNNKDTINLYYKQQDQNISNLEKNINHTLYIKKNILIKVNVNRLEFIIYYLFFKSYIKYNNYDIYVVNRHMDIKNILFYYHKTIYEIVHETYLIIKNYINSIKRK